MRSFSGVRSVVPRHLVSAGLPACRCRSLYPRTRQAMPISNTSYRQQSNLGGGLPEYPSQAADNSLVAGGITLILLALGMNINGRKERKAKHEEADAASAANSISSGSRTKQNKDSATMDRSSYIVDDNGEKIRTAADSSSTTNRQGATVEGTGATKENPAGSPNNAKRTERENNRTNQTTPSPVASLHKKESQHEGKAEVPSDRSQSDVMPESKATPTISSGVKANVEGQDLRPKDVPAPALHAETEKNRKEKQGAGIDSAAARIENVPQDKSHGPRRESGHEVDEDGKVQPRGGFGTTHKSPDPASPKNLRDTPGEDSHVDIARAEDATRDLSDAAQQDSGHEVDVNGAVAPTEGSSATNIDDNPERIAAIRTQDVAKPGQSGQSAALEPVSDSLEEQNEEAEEQGAFNPETGEINWDCPCLGGMAHGPCGEQFKAAFSCFVYSEKEPKGIECVDRFQNMQTCFRQYPELYGSQDDEDDEEQDLEGGRVVARNEPEPESN